MTVDDSTLLDLCLALDPALSSAELLQAFLATWQSRFPDTPVDLRYLPDLQQASGALTANPAECLLPGVACCS